MGVQMKVGAGARLVAAGRVKELLIAETLSEYMKRLKKLGIKELGSGSYGVVFQHPTDPNVVVKLLRQADPDYMTWVEFCKKHPRNPYLPKIIHVASGENVFEPERTGSMPTTMHLVFMEKLTPLSDAEYKQFTREILDLARPMSKRRFVPFDVDCDYRLWDAVSKQKKDSNLAACGKFIAKMGGTGTMLDVHMSNVMKRGEQFVIVDPFAS